MNQIVFHGSISPNGKDRYGEERYAIHIPKRLRDEIKDLVGKEMIIIVIQPDDTEDNK
ncbi:hypothetical protein HLB03_05095 [Acidianus sp. DSM 29099]|nr:hypothetical protein [Acidianus sp. RZ1]